MPLLVMPQAPSLTLVGRSSDQGFYFKSTQKSSAHLVSRILMFRSLQLSTAKCATFRAKMVVRAGNSGYDGRPSREGNFLGGFILGGIIMGTLACVYAPQISRTLISTDRKDLMQKLPKFIFDEEKELENKRRMLAEKIAKLNSSINDISAELLLEDQSATGPSKLETAA